MHHVVLEGWSRGASFLHRRDARVKIIALLDSFKKSHPQALPFALTLVASRLTPFWQLVRLATKAAASKSAADVAATPYACVVHMVLDQLDDRRLALRIALRHNRVLIARDRPVLGGMAWGLFAYKPVWGLAFFLVPLLTRRWRVCVAMGITGIAFPAVGTGQIIGLA